MAEINRPNIKELAEHYHPDIENDCPELRDALRYAYIDGIRAMKNSVLSIIASEPELPGSMPTAVQKHMDDVGTEEALRLLVRLTKSNIAHRIEWLFDDDLVAPKEID